MDDLFIHTVDSCPQCNSAHVGMLFFPLPLPMVLHGAAYRYYALCPVSLTFLFVSHFDEEDRDPIDDSDIGTRGSITLGGEWDDGENDR